MKSWRGQLEADCGISANLGSLLATKLDGMRRLRCKSIDEIIAGNP